MFTSIIKTHFNYKSTSSLKRLCSSKWVILGIETSCDDTGCAIVDNEGNILGEAINSQHLTHLYNGGIIPPIARDLHRKNIEKVVSDAVEASRITFKDIDAIATTVKPGLPLSLKIGMLYGKHLCRKHSKPFIPIHHMEAHALMARMYDSSLQFPFLVLLISGGHCLVAVCKDVDEFLLLGKSMDDAPGEALDKMARRLKMKDILEFAMVPGGQAIEMAAARADDPLKFKFTVPLVKYKNCNFSFSGLKNQMHLHIISQEKENDVPPDGIIPDLYNLCAGFQLIITRHICHRVQRAMQFAESKGLIPAENKSLVVSGGVACNNFIASGLQIICNNLNYKMVRPPPKLCTDNGVMIAWNGIERWRANKGVTTDLDSVDIERSCPLGKSLIEEVEKAQISPKWVKLSALNKPQRIDLHKEKVQAVVPN